MTENRIEGSPSFILRTPLKIGDRTIENRLNRKDIQDLMKVNIAVGSPNPDAHNFLSLNGQRLRVHTCEEYLNAIASGARAGTSFELSMESFFKRSCNTLKYIQSAAPAKQSYLPEQILSDIDSLPVTLLRGLSSDTSRKLSEDTRRGLSLKDYAEKGEIEIVKQQPYHLEVKHKGMSLTWQELLRADFNGDGLEDVLIFGTQHSLQGSFRSYFHVLIENKSESKNLETQEFKN